MDKLDIINAKIDLVYAMVATMPLFIKAPHDKNVSISWDKARERFNEVQIEYQKIEEYRIELQNENIHRTAGFEDKFIS